MGSTYIKEIIFEGFKSFGDKKVTVELGPGFYCIVGPNGSGKSNIIDGLCFALGRLSKKTMRAQNLADLIFVGNKTKKPATKASVSIVFDNSENVFQGYPGEDLTITREIRQDGKGKYMINGKRVTRDQILMNLAMASVDPDGFNFILQGKVVELTHMGNEDRRIFIENLVGLQKFDEEKEKALKELEKADQDLVKFEAIFQEVARQLKRVEKEKNDALRWKALDDKIKELNARLIALNIKKLRDEEEQLSIFIDETKKKIEELDEQITTCKNDIQQEADKMDNLAREIETQEDARNALEAKISNLRSELSSRKTELKLLNENLEKLKERKENLQEKQEKLEPGLTYNDLLDEAQQELEKLNIQIAKTRTEIQDKENQQRALENEINIFQQERDALNKQLNKAGSQKSALETELNITKKNLEKLEKRKASLEKDLSQLLKDKDEDIDKARAQAEEEARALRAEIDDIKLQLKKETQKQKKFEMEINQLRNEISRLDKLVGDLTGKIKVAQSEQDMWEKEISKIRRETKTAEVNKENIKKERESLAEVSKKLDEQLRIKENFLKEIKSQREEVSRKIEDSQKDFEGAEQEIESVMKTLDMFIGGYSDTLNELKAESQEKSLDTVDSSMREFGDYVRDIMEIIGLLKSTLLETVGKPRNDENGESTTACNDAELIEQNFTSVDILLENLDASLQTIKKDLQDNIVDLVQGNTQEFSNFIQDLIEVMSQVNVSMAKLRMTRNTDQINELHELDNKKSELQDEFNELTVEKTRNDGKLKQAELDLKNIEQKLLDFVKQEKELRQKIDEREKLKAELGDKIKEIEAQKSGLQEQIEAKTAEKDEFWEISNSLNEKMEEKNQELVKVNERIRGLETVRKLIKDIEDHEKEIKESSERIETNTVKIAEIEEKIKKIENDKNEKEQQIQQLREKRAAISQEEKDLRTRLEQENKESQAKQRRVATIQTMIAREKEINDLQLEIESLEDQLEEGEGIIEELETSIKEENKKKEEVVKHISELNASKQEVWERQKELQDLLGSLNSQLVTSTNKLSNFENRMADIATKIENLYEDSKQFGTLPEVLEGWTETGIKNDIQKATEEKRILEPVNLKSIEQYEIVKNRFDDIDLRRQSLQRERKAILENIERIELEKTRQFMKAFNEMNIHFSEIFSKLSPGGVAKMVLENPAKPFEGGIAIEARPRGKKIKSIESLSGGEKTLVALSFIFSVEKFQPSPFYVMDEIDAALDGPNVHRVSMLIKEFAQNSQFIVISHREENIVNADKIYGVSMKDSITDVFSIQLDDMEAVGENRDMEQILKEEESNA